jgi:NAD(P)-dependent dehydrogenase (short-subunit alcohol dehydrogenase family)
VNRISGWWERRFSAVEWNTIDLTVAGGADLVVAGDDRAAVQRAERTAGVAAELQGDHPLRIRHTHAFAREVDELLRRVAFLASDRASWITGGDFAIDGGMRKEV